MWCGVWCGAGEVRCGVGCGVMWAVDSGGAETGDALHFDRLTTFIHNYS